MTTKRPRSKPSSDPDPDPPNRPNSSAPGDRSNASKNPSAKSSEKPKPSDPMAQDPDPAAHASSSPAASPLKGQGKRKARELPEEEASPGKSQGKRKAREIWTDEDALALLKAVIEFRHMTGSTPTASTVRDFFGSIKGSLPPRITHDQVYNKLRALRQKYHQTAPSGPQDSPFYRLSSEAWGAEGKKANGSSTVEDNCEVVPKDEAGGEEGGAAEASYPFLTGEIAEHLKKYGWQDEMLKMVLEVIDPEKAKALEGKLRQHYGTELKIQVRAHYLAKEVFTELGVAHKVRGLKLLDQSLKVSHQNQSEDRGRCARLLATTCGHENFISGGKRGEAKIEDDPDDYLPEEVADSYIERNLVLDSSLGKGSTDSAMESFHKSH